MKRSLFSILFATAFSFSCFACWYSKSNYTDYIYSINDQVVIQTNYVGNVIKYTMSNNKKVDFPLTVSMKLVSNQVIDLNVNQSSTAYELIRGKLQYRVLPGGNWITVTDYETPTGTISKDSVPGTYFGKNNIWPKGLKAGDVIMIRLYITDGMWQSGDLANKCEDKLTNVSTEYGTKRTLPNTFSYKMDGTELRDYDLGGAWYPHLAVTVIYSGKERPLR